MTDQNNRYLNSQEVAELNEAVNQYREQPPDFADPIMDALDAAILKDEGLSTLETVTTLARARRAEAERTVARGGGIPENVRQACANDDAMSDLDTLIFQQIRDRAPLAEDGGEAHLNATYDEI